MNTPRHPDPSPGEAPVRPAARPAAHGLRTAARVASLAWTCAAFVVTGTIAVSLFGHAGTGPSAPAAREVGSPESAPPSDPSAPVDPPKLHGPATEVPQEILLMLNQRQRALDRREESLRLAEGRLQSLKQDIEQIVARHERLVKAAESARQGKPKAGGKAGDPASMIQQVANMYETMPAEEAAARLEKIPMDTALSVLRTVKGKTAGAILSQMKPDKAAKLTERLLAGAPAVAVTAR